MKYINILILQISLLLALVGCQQDNSNSHNKHHKVHVVEKKVFVDDTWIYYYFLYNSMSTSPTSYYTSNISTTSFQGKPIQINENTPKEVQEVVDKGEVVQEVDMAQDEAGQITEQLEMDFDAPEANTESVDAVDTSDTSTDVSTDFGDSGGGDSGSSD